MWVSSGARSRISVAWSGTRIGRPTFRRAGDGVCGFCGKCCHGLGHRPHQLAGRALGRESSLLQSGQNLAEALLNGLLLRVDKHLRVQGLLVGI